MRKTRRPIITGALVALAFFAWPWNARAEWKLESRQTLASLANGAGLIEYTFENGDRAVRAWAVTFRQDEVRLAVIDNPSRGPLGDAMVVLGAIAGVNGGYFQADGTPVGLEIAGGKKIHGFERARLLSGVFVVTGGHPRLVRSTHFQPSNKDTDALETGPFLVFDARVVEGLNTARAARRTVIANDGRGDWALLYLEPVTLADAAAILATPGIFRQGRVEQALNFDGGSSSGLWAATGWTPFYLHEFGNVRNFLAILTRKLAK
jgi:hypothetical protein